MHTLVKLARSFKRRMEASDHGFTLIELLVVLLIIGILLAIAIPTFLSATQGADNTAAQSNLETSLTGADTFYVHSNQSYTDLMYDNGSASSLTQIDTGIAYTSATYSRDTETVSVYYQGGDVFIAVAWSPASHYCWGVLDLKRTLSTRVLGKYQSGTYFFVEHFADRSSCDAANFDTSSGSAVTIGTSFPTV